MKASEKDKKVFIITLLIYRIKSCYGLKLVIVSTTLFTKVLFVIKTEVRSSIKQDPEFLSILVKNYCIDDRCT